MFKPLRWIGLAALVISVSSCSYNEELGRSQFLITGSGGLERQAAASWQQYQRQRPVSQDRRYTDRLNRVAPRVLRAAGENPVNWDYKVFVDKSLNAFALPGNRFGINTGIMDIMSNDAQLATVVGHEIAHVRYNHSAERYSQQVGATAVLGIGAIALGSQCDGSSRERSDCQARSAAAAQALGVGAMVGVILPFSRKHETEADVGGVRYMTSAGYDPCESLKFWAKMSAQSAGQQRPPEFLSTHPAPSTRISSLRQIIAQTGRTCS